MRLGMVVAAVLVFSTPAALGQDTQLADLDPLDPETCEVEDGWTVVGKAYLKAWQDGWASGLIDEDLHEALIDYMLQWDEEVTRTGDNTPICLQQIALREEYGF